MSKSSIQIMPFEPGHLQSFVPGAREAAAMAKADLPAMGAFWDSKALSALIDDRCVGIFGAVEIEGSVTVTVLMSDELRARPVSLHRGIRNGLIDILNAGYENINAVARADDARGRKWLGRLGFEMVDDKDGEVKYALWTKY